MHRENTVIYKLRTEASEETNPDLVRLASRSVRQLFTLFKPPSLQYSVLAALTNCIVTTSHLNEAK